MRKTTMKTPATQSKSRSLPSQKKNADSSDQNQSKQSKKMKKKNSPEKDIAPRDFLLFNESLLLMLLLFFCASIVYAGTDRVAAPKTRQYFTRNDGQIDTHGKADCRFYTDAGGGRFYFCADGVVADFQKSGLGTRDLGLEIDSQQSLREPRVANPEPRIGHVLKLNFLSRTNFAAIIDGEEVQEYKCNYFIGNDSKKWHWNVPNYSRIVYHDVWKGIDVQYRSARFPTRAGTIPMDRDRATLEYDVIVHPGADPKQIQFSYKGGDDISISEDGALVVKTSLGDVIEQTPYVYQIIDDKKKEIQSSFRIHNSVFSIEVGEYDKTKELVIDPVYSTLLGGPNDDVGSAIAVDAAGNAYITGGTIGLGFPTTYGAYDLTSHGGTYSNVFVTKVNPSGIDLVYSTFLGGLYADGGSGIAVDAGGNAYVTGNTGSYDFPTTPGSYNPTRKGGEGIGPIHPTVFLTKLNSTGTALKFSTYLGGLLSEWGCGIAVDTIGCAYVTGYTASPDFPTTSGAYDTIPKASITNIHGGEGGYDAFITKFDPAGKTLIYSTFLGGAVSLNTQGYSVYTKSRSISLDKANNAYVTGSTTCLDFPHTSGAYDTAYDIMKKGPPIAFVTKFNANGNSLSYSTFLGGTGSDYGYGIAVDSGGNAYVTGVANSTNFPTTQGAYSSNGSGVFVTKFNPSGSNLVYSTLIGGADYSAGITVDREGNAYITGHAVGNSPTTQGAFQLKGGAFVTKINTVGSALVYSTRLGSPAANGDHFDIGSGIAVDVEGDAYVVGQTNNTDFPTTPGAYQTSCKGKTDAFVTKFCFVPTISVQENIDFGAVECSQDENLLINNLAEIPLTVDTITFTTFNGKDSLNFSLVNPSAFPLTIDPRSSSTVVVRFARGLTGGDKFGRLNIHSNDRTPLSDSLKYVYLKGTLDSIGILSKPDGAINLGNLGCSDTSHDTTIVVQNIGQDTLTVVSLLVGSGSTSYSITPNSAVIPPDSSANFVVHFQPSGSGSFGCKVVLSDEGCLKPGTLSLSGSKISTASISGLPKELNYSALTCSSDGISRDSVIFIKNTGSTAITLHSGPITDSAFKLISPLVDTVINAGDSVKYIIRFVPSRTGKFNTPFTISGPCNITSSHTLVGTKDSIGIYTKAGTINFGGLECNDAYRDSVVVVRNTGNVSLTAIPNIIGTGYSITPLSKIIAAGGVDTFKVRFQPGGSNDFEAKVTFQGSLCSAGTDTIQFKGWKNSSAGIEASPMLLQFITCDSVDSIVITNTSNRSVDLDSAKVSGSGFTLISPLGKIVSLLPGRSQTYKIQYKHVPGGPGDSLGSFIVTASPCHLRVSSILKGSCKSPLAVEQGDKYHLQEFSLGQNYPNPFSRLSVVGYQLPRGCSHGAFEIRNMLGRIIRYQTIDDKIAELTIDARDLPNGLYLYSLTDGMLMQSRIMIVTK